MMPKLNENTGLFDDQIKVDASYLEQTLGPKYNYWRFRITLPIDWSLIDVMPQSSDYEIPSCVELIYQKKPLFTSIATDATESQAHSYLIKICYKLRALPKDTENLPEVKIKFIFKINVKRNDLGPRIHLVPKSVTLPLQNPFKRIYYGDLLEARNITERNDIGRNFEPLLMVDEQTKNKDKSLYILQGQPGIGKITFQYTWRRSVYLKALQHDEPEPMPIILLAHVDRPQELSRNSHPDQPVPFPTFVHQLDLALYNEIKRTFCTKRLWETLRFFNPEEKPSREFIERLDGIEKLVSQSNGLLEMPDCAAYTNSQPDPHPIDQRRSLIAYHMNFDKAHQTFLGYLNTLLLALTNQQDSGILFFRSPIIIAFNNVERLNNYQWQLEHIGWLVNYFLGGTFPDQIFPTMVISTKFDPIAGAVGWSSKEDDNDELKQMRQDAINEEKRFRHISIQKIAFPNLKKDQIDRMIQERMPTDWRTDWSEPKPDCKHLMKITGGNPEATEYILYNWIEQKRNGKLINSTSTTDNDSIQKILQALSLDNPFEQSMKQLEQLWDVYDQWLEHCLPEKFHNLAREFINFLGRKQYDCFLDGKLELDSDDYINTHYWQSSKNEEMPLQLLNILERIGIIHRDPPQKYRLKIPLLAICIIKTANL